MNTEFYSVYDVPIDQLLGVPPDESDLHGCWEGFGAKGGQLAAPYFPSTHDETPDATSPETEWADHTVDGFEANGGQLAAPHCPSTHDEAPDATPPETECATHTADGPESGWRRKRGPRKRRVLLCTDQSWHLGNHFGQTSHRTNNSHWTPEEVATLVDGVKDCGVARWSAMKKKWFPTSVRTASNLKDKWRNLLESYTGNAERSCYLHLDKKLIERIKKAALNNPYPKPRCTDE
uniref:Myb-like domain-containing protein n=1 Tax=Triticum urartu TaxID=4572 RepID=A0A8R7P9U8_TRIUA